MRLRSQFSAAQRPQRTAGNRKNTAKTVKKPTWPQSKHKPPATFRKTAAAFRRQKHL